jgi:hypothetical protein
VSGYFHVLSHIRDGFAGPSFEQEHPERYPRFVEDPSGELRVVPDDAAPAEVSDAARTLVPRRHGGSLAPYEVQ